MQNILCCYLDTHLSTLLTLCADYSFAYVYKTFVEIDFSGLYESFHWQTHLFIWEWKKSRL